MEELPITPLKLKRQNAYFRDKKYYRYYELIDTIEEQKKENIKLKEKLNHTCKIIRGLMGLDNDVFEEENDFWS